MLLEKKIAVVYGGGGAIGGAVARAFAREGAEVHLAGRTREPLEEVAAAIAAGGGTAHPAPVDVLDEDAVTRHAAGVGRFDVSFNAAGLDLGEQGVPLAELTARAFMAPVAGYLRAAFTTASAAARHLGDNGVILGLTSPMAREPAALAGPYGIAGAAVENLTRQLALELGGRGIRVLGLRLTGIPETAARLGSHTGEIWGRAADRLGVPFDELLARIGGGTCLGRPLTVGDVAGVAVFLASDRAAGITGTIVNVTGGAVGD